MSDRFITDQNIADFHMFLIDEERSSGTIKKYIHDSRMFKTWLGECPVNKEKAAQWKRELIESGRAPATVNSRLMYIPQVRAYILTLWKRALYRGLWKAAQL